MCLFVCLLYLFICLFFGPGVEDVMTDCKTHKVVVKGEKADPLKVLERVQRKSHRQVELLSPIPKPPAEEEKKPEEKEKPKPEEKKEEVCQSALTKKFSILNWITFIIHFYSFGVKFVCLCSPR